MSSCPWLREEPLKYCYDVGLTTCPKPLESIERKVGAYGDEIFGFMEMRVNTKAYLVVNFSIFILMQS